MNDTATVEHDRLGRYELLLRMASGGMASLWLARISGPDQFEKLICIKKVHEHLVQERRFIEMFVDESRIAALIGHPNVATVFDMGHIEGQYYMALEYVHGHNMGSFAGPTIAWTGPTRRAWWPTPRPGCTPPTS
jgi:serine/threonine-protein kinase